MIFQGNEKQQTLRTGPDTELSPHKEGLAYINSLRLHNHPTKKYYCILILLKSLKHGEIK